MYSNFLNIQKSKNFKQMKIQYLLFIAFLNVSLLSFAQSNKGTVVTDTLYSKNLENDFGENPSRAVSVYLPPNYQNSDQHYPVIYFLHGFMGDNKMMDMMSGLLDYAIADKKIK
jgi:enterochelin esterase-like enzyme